MLLRSLRHQLAKKEETMKALNWHHRVLMMLTLAAVPVFANVGCDGFGGGDCVVGGCSGQSCGEPEDESGLITTCEYREEYACYKQHGVCERNAQDQCGWRPSQELQDCITAARALEMGLNRTPVSSECIRNSPDTCTTDADCVAGGCGGELCHGVANMAVSDCNCTAPQGISCGCVGGTCSWWQ